MHHSFEEVGELAHALPDDQRIQLANSFYESPNADEEETGEAQIASAWDEEIKRRLDEIDSGAVEMAPGEEVMDRMMKRLSPEARSRLVK